MVKGLFYAVRFYDTVILGTLVLGRRLKVLPECERSAVAGSRSGHSPVSEPGEQLTPVCLQFLLHEVSVPTLPSHTFKDNSAIYKPSLSRVSTRAKTIQYDDTCPVFRLQPDEESPREEVACRRTDFVPGSCRIMKELFADKETANCSHQLSHMICEMKNYNPAKPEMTCRHDLCSELSVVVIGIYNEDMGVNQWKKFKSTEEAMLFINQELLLDWRTYHHGYCFIRCLGHDGRKISQLLILPPVLRTSSNSLKKLKNKHALNVNILLLDSVSRHHFYRTLPKTINTFINLNTNVFKTGYVFDFELVQGIKSRTFESLQALFGGEAFNPLKPFSSFVLPPKAVDFNKTLGHFKDFGYEILYLEDMCWKWEWGLVKELRALNKKAVFSERVKLFLEAVKRSGIDRIDVSYSSCDILQENMVKDMFHGPATLCYNGIHQHTYLLQYIEYFITRFSFLQKPLFSFLMLDTNHEDTGLRLKQLDEDLAKHVSFLADQQNTVTFILSDHGNNYGQFVSMTTESQIEIFHTTLFIIVPDTAAILLGEEKIKSLHTNQRRLISLLDIHHTLKGLLPPFGAKYGKILKDGMNTDGLLSPVSASRTCNSIPRIPPNFCICQDFEKPAVSDSRFALYAEFALGQMNHEILQQQRASKNSHIGYVACQKLVGVRFDNGKVHEDKNETIVEFDLYVKAPESAGHDEEKYFVVINFCSQVDTALTLVGVDRLTPYSPYQVCAADNVDLRLCICDLENGHEAPILYWKNVLTPTVSWTETNFSSIHESCLYLIKRHYTSGIVLAVANTCPHVQYDIEFDFLTVNMYSSSVMPVNVSLWPGTEKLLTVGFQKAKGKPWKYKYSLNYRAIPLQDKSTILN
ncbi:uncharacterized protein LOC132205997 [Stegostoma tigrinum]|uniref:uncharacterized protein LOC132205997 n=1 Tax=Stegostoma tigrinum TaxID=3053191 RepID=UPI0028708999|nr:uncharacterized protein LOC132205997 [Stegostoma tigrinum]